MAETKDELPVVAYAHFAENGNVRLWSPNMSNENLIALTETLGKSPVALCKFISAAAKIAELQQEVEGLRKDAECGWLVEYNSKIPGIPGGPSWVCIAPKFGGYGKHELAFTNDPNKALRLARKEDAEAIRLLKVGVREANRRKDWYAESFTVTEHMWLDAAIDRSLSGGEGGGNG